MNGCAERLTRACYNDVKIVSPLWVEEYAISDCISSVNMRVRQDETKYRPQVGQKIADSIAAHNLRKASLHIYIFSEIATKNAVAPKCLAVPAPRCRQTAGV
jgi:hypothetical protein